MTNWADKSKSITVIVAVLVLGFMLITALNGAPVLAQDEAEIACRGIAAAGGDCGGGEDQLNSVVQSVINILLFVVGIAAVIGLIIGGIRYTVSGGDQQAVATAKNTIIYSIVGLIVAVLAYAAVNYVFTLIDTGSAPASSGGGQGGGSAPEAN